MQPNESIHYGTSLFFRLPLSWGKPPSQDVYEETLWMFGQPKCRAFADAEEPIPS